MKLVFLGQNSWWVIHPEGFRTSGNDLNCRTSLLSVSWLYGSKGVFFYFVFGIPRSSCRSFWFTIHVSLFSPQYFSFVSILGPPILWLSPSTSVLFDPPKRLPISSHCITDCPCLKPTTGRRILSYVKINESSNYTPLKVFHDSCKRPVYHL